MPPSSTEPIRQASWAQVLALRLERHHLGARTSPDRLVDVVREMVGLHAQVMSSAELQLAARIDGLRPDDVRDALWKNRRLVKAWAFRNTLHLLTPDDLAAFVASAAVQETWRMRSWLRYFDLTEEQVEGLIAAIAALLSDQPMTRGEIADAVAARLGREDLAEKMRTGWSTFLGPAGRRGHLIFGPSQGRNVAFVKPEAWLGRSVVPRKGADPADGLAAIVARYLVAFPGASRDMMMRWWGALRARPMTEALRRSPVPLEEVEIEGMRGWVRAEDAADLAGIAPFEGVRLLPGFDPFTNELPRHVETVLPDAHHDRVHRQAGWVSPVVIVDGRVAGTWEIRGGPKDGRVEVVPFGRWRGGARKELAPEVDRVAAFLDRPVALRVEPAVG